MTFAAMLQQPTILVIEDDDDIRTIVSRLFTAQGYRVSEVADGLSAFDRARQRIPALIVLDLGLPGRDGWTVEPPVIGAEALAA